MQEQDDIHDTLMPLCMMMSCGEILAQSMQRGKLMKCVRCVAESVPGQGPMEQDGRAF